MLITGLWDLIMANADPPCDISMRKWAEKKVKVVQPLYELETRAFKGLQETIGFISIRGDTDERVL